MPVETETKSTSGGTPPLVIHAWTRGSSAWQWGHQWAKKRIALGRPSRAIEPVAVVTVGAVTPTAGSVPVSGNGSSGVPSMTGALPAASEPTGPEPPAAEGTTELTPAGEPPDVAWADDPVELLGIALADPPAPLASTIATTTATTTTTPAIAGSTHGWRVVAGGCGGGVGCAGAV